MKTEQKVPISAQWMTAESFTMESGVRAGGATGKGKRNIKIKAYGGGIYPHPYWGRVGIDLGSLKVPERFPVLRSHDPYRVIGAIQKTRTKGAIECDGFLSPAIEDGRELMGLLEDGDPMQASTGIDIRGAKILEVSKGAAHHVNGKFQTGPFTFFENSYLREVSVVPFGSDRGTATALASVEVTIHRVYSGGPRSGSAHPGRTAFQNTSTVTQSKNKVKRKGIRMTTTDIEQAFESEVDLRDEFLSAEELAHALRAEANGLVRFQGVGNPSPAYKRLLDRVKVEGINLTA